MQFKYLFFSGPAHVVPPFEVCLLIKVVYTEAPITLSFVITDGGNIKSVQWWINGVLVTSSGRFSIDPNNTWALTINNIIFDDYGFYQAEVMTDQSVRAKLNIFLLVIKRKTMNLTFKNTLLERTFINHVVLKPSCCVSQKFPN